MSKKIEEIKEKLKNNNFNLDENEQRYFNHSFELQNIFIEKMKSGEIFEIDEHTYDLLEQVSYFDEPEDLPESFWIAFIKAVILYEDLDFYTRYSIALEYIHQEKYLNELEQIELEMEEKHHLLDNEDYTFIKIKRLLSKGKYEDIMKINTNINAGNIGTNEIERAFKDFPFEKYGVPKALNGVLELFEEQYEYMTFNQLVILFEKTYTEINNDNDNVANKVIAKICKTANHELISTIEDKKRFITALNTKCKLYATESERNSAFTAQLFNNLGIDMKFSNVNSSSNYPTKFEEYVHDASKSELNYHYLMSVLLIFNKEYIQNSNDLFEMIKKHKDYNELIINYIESPKYQSEVDEIVKEAIKNKDKKIIEFFKDRRKAYEYNFSLSETIYEHYFDDIIENDLLKDVQVTTNIVNNKSDKLLNYLSNHHNKRLNVSTQISKKYLYKLFETGVNEETLYSVIKRSFPTNDYLEIYIELIKKSYNFSKFVLSWLDEEIYGYPRIITTLLDRNDTITLDVLDLINHNEKLEHYYDVVIYDTCKDFLCEYYNYDINKLDYVTNIVGYKILRYIDNSNLKKILSLPEDKLSMVMSLLPKEELTKADLEGIYDAVKQHTFIKYNENTIEIFSNIMHSIDDVKNNRCDDSNATYHSDLNTLANGVDKNFIKNTIDKYDIQINEDLSNLDILEYLKIQILNNTTKCNECINALHEITNYYIARQRESYRSSYNVYKDLNIPFYIDKKGITNILINYFIKNVNGYDPRTKSFITSIDYRSDRVFYEFNEYIIENKLDPYLVMDVINYVKDPNSSLINDLNLVRKNIGLVKKIFENIILNNYDFVVERFNDYIKNEAFYNDRVNKQYIIPESSIDLSSILVQLDLDVLNDKVFNNEDVYKSLIEIMKKNKIHLFPRRIVDCISSLDIDFDVNYVICLINYFYKIKETTNVDSLGIIELLKKCKSYATVSSKYSIILGDEDAKLILANPGPNTATHATASERLNKALELTIQNFERQEVTIPTFNDVFENNDKKMRIVVGNFTHPSTLTHGERTGACMRIGGVGDSLFNFALDNKNGFHIRFEDPETGEYISRVTGFRNGNTVFLNELRESCNKEKYSNNDVIEFCTLASHKLIEMSKNSECPINNVVVHRAYATEEMHKKDEDLNVSNIKEGLPDFYSDVNRWAILLASSNEDNSLVPVNLDNSKVQSYKVAREKPIISKDVGEMISIINRVHGIKEYLETNEALEIDFVEDIDNFEYGMANQDWYVYVDKNGNIHGEVIDIDERALEEYNKAYDQIEEYIKTKQTSVTEKSGSYGL